MGGGEGKMMNLEGRYQMGKACAWNRNTNGMEGEREEGGGYGRHGTSIGSSFQEGLNFKILLIVRLGGSRGPHQNIESFHGYTRGWNHSGNTDYL